MMRNKLIAGCIALVLASCGKESNVVITGTIKEAEKVMIYLEQNDVNAHRTIDSTRTDKAGHFEFELNIEQPTFYTLRFPGNENVTVVLTPNETAEITGTLKDLSNNYWVEATTDNSLWIKLLNFQLNRTLTLTDSLQKAYQALPEDKAYDAQREEYAKAWDEALTKQIEFTRDFIIKHAVSPASYYALYQRLNDQVYIMDELADLHYFKVVASSLNALYPESQYTKAIMNHLQQISDAIRNQQLIDVINNTAQSLPNIELPNADGDTLSLQPIRSKLVVLDFGLITSQDSKEYINQMKEIYRQFKNRGVEIYQVCLDPNRLFWSETVKQEGITWKCVWDANALQSRIAATWNVKSIPANYIINEKLEIVGKNLYGDRLADRLNDLLQRN